MEKDHELSKEFGLYPEAANPVFKVLFLSKGVTSFVFYFPLLLT